MNNQTHPQNETTTTDSAAAELFGAAAERETFESSTRARAEAPSVARLPWVVITITATFVFDC